MRALLSVEIRRILSRRAVLAAAALVLLGMLIAGIVLFARSHRPDAETLRARQQESELIRRQAVDECVGGGFGIPPEEVPPGMTLEEYCEQVVGTVEIEDPGFSLVRYREVAEGLSGLFIGLVMILAASFIGAEWHAGTVTTQLTWEPRRNRVLAAKVVTAALFGFAFFLLAEAVLLGTVAPAALFRGTTQGVDAAWVRGVIGVVLRGAGAAAFAGAIAFSLASLARNTAAAVGGLFVYMAILEPLIRAVRPKWQPWYLFDNLGTFISGHPPDPGFSGRSVTGAGVLVSIYTLGFVLLALAVFRRRDVT
jgi:ABC-2 type transport system permease protein